MGLVSRLGKAFWIGPLLIGLSIAVWFVAPQAQSCVIDFDLTTCDATWVVILNVIGLILFLAGSISMFVAGGLARSRPRSVRERGGDDPR